MASADDAGHLRPVTVSTNHLPPEQQFEAWRDTCVPYLDTGRPRAPREAGFAARGVALTFGPFMYYHAVLPPYDYSRTPARIRRDSLDHWIIAFCARGEQRQRTGDREITFAPHMPYVLTMARPFEAVRAGPEIEWHSLFIARDAVPELEPLLTAALYSPLNSGMGRMLARWMRDLNEVAPDLLATDAPHLATATTAMLTAALPGAAASAMREDGLVEPLQLTRLKRLVRENLGSATLGPGRLCAMGGISRSALYRLFEPLGGVARFIQRERLLRAWRLLTDPAERRGIAEIAEAVGFFEPSTFSRSFRAEFGVAPRDARAAALAGQAQPPSPWAGAAANDQADFSALLRGL